MAHLLLCVGHAVAYWLKHYATMQKVAGLILGEMNEFFFGLPNPPERTRPWGSLSL
jgi:hypothetical protein